MGDMLAVLHSHTYRMLQYINKLARLERSPLLRLPHLPIVRTSHLGPQTNQHLLHAHIPIPISRSRDFGIDNIPSVGIDAAHVDFGNEADFGGHGGVAFGDGDAQFVEAHFVLGLYDICV